MVGCAASLSRPSCFSAARPQNAENWEPAGTHGAHVLGGVVGLTYMTYKAYTGGYTPDNAVSIEYFGLYWHFVDLAWVLVFPAFYLY